MNTVWAFRLCSVASDCPHYPWSCSCPHPWWRHAHAVTLEPETTAREECQ